MRQSLKSRFFRIDFYCRNHVKMYAYMANVAQLVRALDCGSKGRGFESRRSPFLFQRGFRDDPSSITFRDHSRPN